MGEYKNSFGAAASGEGAEGKGEHSALEGKEGAFRFSRVTG